MDFRISGLRVEPFIPFFARNDAELLALGARHVVARPEDAPLMQPCRVGLRDSTAGGASILLHFPHHVAPTSPYRAGGPIFVREGVIRRDDVAFLHAHNARRGCYSCRIDRI
jgi:hypothetical protein